MVYGRHVLTLSSISSEKLITPHAQRERGKVIDRGVHIYIYMSVVEEKKLNRTLEIDSPFQTLTVGLLVKFIDYLYYCALQKCSPH